MRKFFGAKSLGFKIIALTLSVVGVVAVACEIFLMPQISERMYSDRRVLIRVSIETALGVFEAMEKKVKAGVLTVEEAKAQAIHTVNTFRYNDKEYFFLINTDGIMLDHPINAKLNGTNVLGMKDPEGVQLFARMIEMANRDGQGYLKYMWPKPGSPNPVPKFSYVEKFAPWNWILGTGLYIDDIEAEIGVFHRRIWMGLLAIAALMSLVCFVVGRNISRSAALVSDGIAHRAEDIKHVSDKLNAQSQALSASTTQSSAAIQQTSSSLTEITSMITKTSDHVSNLLRISGEFEEQVSMAGDRIDQMATSMGHIEGKSKEFADQASSSMEELRQIQDLFKQIADKTKVINDIVFQTKLLSFNASVEAARAGEAGKGFAVVAQEVGNLAEMSGNSSLEISDILAESGQRIESIIKNSHERTDRMVTEIGEALQMGAANARSCQTSFVTIVEGTRNMGSMVTEISHAAKEQSAGVQEISKAIDSLDQATQENASIAQAASGDAADLLKGALGLHDDAHRMAALIKGA